MSARQCGSCGDVIEASWRYCRKCGHPTGVAGSPAPQAKSSKPMWLVIVIVLLALAVPVTGIIAAIAIPNLLTAMQRAKQKRTMADIRSVATAIEAYAVDYNTYPPHGSSLDDLAALVEPTYIRLVPRLDGWEREIRYDCLTTEGDRCLEYAFQSAGKDGEFEDLSLDIEPEATTRFECDIVYVNGQFIRYPSGTHR